MKPVVAFYRGERGTEVAVSYFSAPERGDGLDVREVERAYRRAAEAARRGEGAAEALAEMLALVPKGYAVDAESLARCLREDAKIGGLEAWEIVGRALALLRASAEAGSGSP